MSASKPSKTGPSDHTGHSRHAILSLCTVLALSSLTITLCHGHGVGLGRLRVVSRDGAQLVVLLPAQGRGLARAEGGRPQHGPPRLGRLGLELRGCA